MDCRGNNGPSHVSVEGHLKKIGQQGVGGVGTDHMTVRRGTMVRHRVPVMSFSDRTEDSTFILCASHGILKDNLYVYNLNT